MIPFLQGHDHESKECQSNPTLCDSSCLCSLRDRELIKDKIISCHMYQALGIACLSIIFLLQEPVTNRKKVKKCPGVFESLKYENETFWSDSHFLTLFSLPGHWVLNSPGKEKTWRRMDSCSWRAVFCLPLFPFCKVNVFLSLKLWSVLEHLSFHSLFFFWKVLWEGQASTSLRHD